MLYYARRHTKVPHHQPTKKISQCAANLAQHLLPAFEAAHNGTSEEDSDHDDKDTPAIIGDTNATSLSSACIVFSSADALFCSSGFCETCKHTTTMVGVVMLGFKY
jgi:hypothetical protein